MFPGPQPKPKGRYNWGTGKVEPLEDHEWGGWGPTAQMPASPPQPPQPPSGAPRSTTSGPSDPGRRPIPPWQSKLRHGIDLFTNAQMRQAAFRAPHGLTQAVRYAAGLDPMGRGTLGMYRAETYQNLALSPRQFPGAEQEEEP